MVSCIFTLLSYIRRSYSFSSKHYVTPEQGPISLPRQVSRLPRSRWHNIYYWFVCCFQIWWMEGSGQWETHLMLKDSLTLASLVQFLSIVYCSFTLSKHFMYLFTAYTAKYASSFYGPFRDALSSHPGIGDKKVCQPIIIQQVTGHDISALWIHGHPTGIPARSCKWTRGIDRGSIGPGGGGGCVVSKARFILVCDVSCESAHVTDLQPQECHILMSFIGCARCVCPQSSVIT